MSDDFERDPDDAEPGPEKSVHGVPNPPVEDCPVAFLGWYGENVVFAMPEGAIRVEKSTDIARKIKLDIFNRIEGQSFLVNFRDADDKFMRDAAALWFIRHARAAGIWDNTRPQRGLGVWPGHRGQVVLHRGQELITYQAGRSPIKTSVAEALRDPESPIYAVKPNRPAPAAPASVSDGQWLRDSLDAWHWEPIGDDGLTGADVMAGWLMAGMLGAVAPFRPHVLLSALMGCGKTTLISHVHAALSAIAGDVLDSFTKAGLANDLGGMARPVVIDEAEASATPHGVGPVEEALELIRRMATGSGALRKMGTIGGGSITQTAVGSVMMAAINPVSLSPADASRILEIRLLPLNVTPGEGSPFRPIDDTAIADMIDKAKGLAPALLGRALSGAHRYLSDFAWLKQALKLQGQSPRSADLVAAIAAGRRLLLSDQPLDEAEAAEEAQFWRGILAAREQAEMVGNPGADCFAHLMGYASGQHVHDRIYTIGELVERWVRGMGSGSTEDVSDIEAVLREHGLKIQFVGEGPKRQPWLLVAHHAPGLTRIFDRTPWKDHRRTLPYLDALGDDFKTKPGKPQRFGLGVVQRTTAIPLAPWLGRSLNA